MKGNKIYLRGLGAFIGLIAPLITFYFFFLLKYAELGFQVFVNRLLYTTLFAPMLSLAVLINLLMFFIFIWLNKDEGSRGVLMSTLLYAFIVFGFKLFG